MIVRLALMGILMAAVGAVLSELGWKYGKVYSVICAVILLSGVGEGLSGIFSDVLSISDTAGISDVAKCALKILGAGYVFGICADTARDLGEAGVARAITIASKCEILLLTLPYLSEILSFGLEFIK